VHLRRQTDCPEVPSERIVTTFGLWCRLVDPVVINFKFWDNLSKRLNFTRGRSYNSFRMKLTSPNSGHCEVVGSVWQQSQKWTSEWTSCAGAATIYPAPLLPLWAPTSASRRRADRNVYIALGSHGEYVPTLTAPAAWNAAVSKAAWWPWSFDLQSGVRVTCDLDYLCANFSLPRPLCSRLTPDVRDRQTDGHQTALMCRLVGAGP